MYRISIKQIRRIIEAFTCSSTIHYPLMRVEKRKLSFRFESQSQAVKKKPFFKSKNFRNRFLWAKVIYGNGDKFRTQSDGNSFSLSTAEESCSPWMGPTTHKKWSSKAATGEKKILNLFPSHLIATTIFYGRFTSVNKFSKRNKIGIKLAERLPNDFFSMNCKCGLHFRESIFIPTDAKLLVPLHFNSPSISHRYL